MINGRFITDCRSKYGLDFQELWREGMKTSEGTYAERTVKDEAEEKFWEGLAPTYDHSITLYDYAPQVLDKILELLGPKVQDAIEIGPGTGKFTLPISKKLRKLSVVDSSINMLKQLQKNLEAQLPDAVGNVKYVHGKWEETEIEVAGGIFEVNALYRMWEIRKSLYKMNQTARHMVVLVWTQQRSRFDNFFKELGIAGEGTKTDYIYLMILLYEMGIDADLEFMQVVKPMPHANIEELYEACLSELEEQQVTFQQTNADTDQQLRDKLMAYLESNTTVIDGQLIFHIKLQVAFVHWKPQPYIKNSEEGNKNPAGVQ